MWNYHAVLTEPSYPETVTPEVASTASRCLDLHSLILLICLDAGRFQKCMDCGEETVQLEQVPQWLTAGDKLERQVFPWRGIWVANLQVYHNE